jgi:hypothetical protein
MENSREFLKKLKTDLPMIHMQKNIDQEIVRVTCTPMFIVALFKIAKL